MENLNWTQAMVEKKQHQDTYWFQVGLVLTQLQGMVDGYNANGNYPPLTHTQILLLNLCE